MYRKRDAAVAAQEVLQNSSDGIFNTRVVFFSSCKLLMSQNDLLLPVTQEEKAAPCKTRETGALLIVPSSKHRRRPLQWYAFSDVFFVTL